MIIQTKLPATDRKAKASGYADTGPVFDPLSIAYFFRLHPLVQNGGGGAFVTVKVPKIVTAGKRPKIKLPSGEFTPFPPLRRWKILEECSTKPQRDAGSLVLG